MPLGHTNVKSSSPQVNQSSSKKANSNNQTPSTKRKQRSSDTEKQSPDHKKMSTVPGMQDSQSLMTLLEDSWDIILQKLQSSDVWRAKESFLNHMDQDMADLKRENEILRQRLGNAEGRLTRLENKLEEVNEKILELTTRSMRDNLVCKNIEESRGDTEEDIGVKLVKFFREKLNIEEHDVKKILIERAHRVGKESSGCKRNIIAKLNSKGKSVVMSHLRNLNKRDPVKVQEQFPPEIHTRRNKLWSSFVQARLEGQQAKFNVDKLIVNKKSSKAY